MIPGLVQKIVTPWSVCGINAFTQGLYVTAHAALRWEYCQSGAKMIYYISFEKKIWSNPFFFFFHVLCIWIVCFSELVKLFCTEESHRKVLKLFLQCLITSLHVSDARCLQTSITNPQLVQSQSARHPQCYHSYVHTLPGQSWLELRLIGCFKGAGGLRTSHGKVLTSLRSRAAEKPLKSDSLKVNTPKLWFLATEYANFLCAAASLTHGQNYIIHHEIRSRHAHDSCVDFAK